MSQHLRRWGAVYILVALFLASAIPHAVLEVRDAAEQARHYGEPYTTSQGLLEWLRATLENWQSEWAQLVVQALILLGFKKYIFRVEQEDIDQIKADLAAIRAQIE